MSLGFLIVHRLTLVTWAERGVRSKPSNPPWIRHCLLHSLQLYQNFWTSKPITSAIILSSYYMTVCMCIQASEPQCTKLLRDILDIILYYVYCIFYAHHYNTLPSIYSLVYSNIPKIKLQLHTYSLPVNSTGNNKVPNVLKIYITIYTIYNCNKFCVATKDFITIYT